MDKKQGGGEEGSGMANIRIRTNRQTRGRRTSKLRAISEYDYLSYEWGAGMRGRSLRNGSSCFVTNLNSLPKNLFPKKIDSKAPKKEDKRQSQGN